MPFDEDQLDALTEIVNIGVGRAAASLHTLVERRIDLRVPRVRVCRHAELAAELDNAEEPVDTSVVQGFEGAISGKALLAFPKRSGIALAKMVAQDPEADDLTDESLEIDLAEILEEIGNIVLNGVLGSLANVFGDDFQYSVPELCFGAATGALSRDASLAGAGEEPTCLLADAQFQLSDSDISGSLLLAFNTQQLCELLDRLLDTVDA